MTANLLDNPAIVSPNKNRKKIGDVEIKVISIKEVEKYCRIAFAEDNDLWERFHIPDNDFETTVANNIKNIYELAYKTFVDCYALFYKGEPVGFFVVTYVSPDNGFLYSFGINKNFRTREITLSWFRLVCGLFPSTFMIFLRSENTRAINFFIRNGMRKLTIEEGHVVLIFNKD